tara:strand:+ start:2088 stop:2783 length:696 start_codon:yes stop_codon:yes gene_type:complete
MDNYLYLIINISAISIPLILSFEYKVKYFKKFLSLAPGLILTIAFFIAWDVFFTELGIWGFNKSYLIGMELFSLPFEEWLFFLCIPYSSLFIHFCKENLTPKLKLSSFTTRYIVIGLSVFLIILSILNINKFYTFSSFILAATAMILSFFRAPQLLSSFFVSFIFILIPFFIINGLLTGSFIIDEIVWYNNHHNLGLRIGTIPFEDIFYGFSLLFLPLYINHELDIKNISN